MNYPVNDEVTLHRVSLSCVRDITSTAEEVFNIGGKLIIRKTGCNIAHDSIIAAVLFAFRLVISIIICVCSC